MKISFSTNAFIGFSLEESLQKIAGIGFQGVEILADVPHLYAPTSNLERINATRQTLSRLNLAVANLNANTAVGFYDDPPPEQLFGPSLADKDEGLRKWRVGYTKRCIDLAAGLGCPSVSVTSGKPQPGLFPEAALRKLMRSLKELLLYAESKNVLIALEYEPGLLVESARETIELLNHLRRPNIGVNLDLGHAWVQGEDPGEVIDLFGKSVFHIHLEDIRGRKHYHLIPGEGEIEFEKIFDKLKQIDYNGFVSIELYTYPDCPEKAAKKAFLYLAPFFSTGGRSK